MNRQIITQAQQASTANLSSQNGILQHPRASCCRPKIDGCSAGHYATRAAQSTPSLPIIQPKLTVSTPNDKYEQEAEQVAEQIMQSPTPAGQNEVAMRASQGPHIQCLPSHEKEKQKLQTKGISSRAPEVTPAVASHIQSLQGGGQALPDSARSFFEPRFGRDFSHIRVHTDSSAKALQARAYTSGNNIVFGAGQYAPETNAGRRLLAHELVHTIQQGASPSVQFIQRDLAVEHPNPDAVVRELSQEELQAAIEFNRTQFRREDEIRNLRDVLGVSPEPAVIDEDLVRAVVQWQATNNLDQDGKIGPRTARVIGQEMLAESSLAPAQRRPAVQMLERGITLSLANDTYTDTATTSTKTIGFNVLVPAGLNLRDYALVNFLRGQMWIVPGPTHPNVQMYGAPVPFNFPAEQVDSVDTDPIYWSTAGSRWNYNISGRTFSATDSPSPRPGNIFNPGESADVDFRIAVFRIRDLPLVTAGNIGTATPLVSRRWRFSVARDVAGTITHP